VFQIHGVDSDGEVVVCKRVRRSKVLEFFAALSPCLVGIEACPGAHHWSRELQTLGHKVRLIPPNYVKAYLKRSKNNANDAAIREAVTRPSMRFVPTKSEEQQSGLMLHRSRQLLIRQRTMLSNAIRGHMAELGVVSAKGRNGMAELLEIIAHEGGNCIPAAARFSLVVLARQYAAIAAEIGAIDKHIHARHRSCEESSRLEEIPGVGPIVATALVAEVGDWKAFSSGRNLAAWIGLVPKQHSTGGKDRLGGISKQGNRYLRWLLVAGAMAVIRYARRHGTKRAWLIHGGSSDWYRSCRSCGTFNRASQFGHGVCAAAIARPRSIYNRSTHPRNRHTQAPVRCGRPRQNRRGVPRRTTAAGSGVIHGKTEETTCNNI
jgi:transposase